MRCPVCKLGTGYYYAPQVDPDAPLERLPYPLYQGSYPGELEYISPRCERCYDKAERKLAKRLKVDTRH